MRLLQSGAVSRASVAAVGGDKDGNSASDAAVSMLLRLPPASSSHELNPKDSTKIMIGVDAPSVAPADTARLKIHVPNRRIADRGLVRALVARAPSEIDVVIVGRTLAGCGTTAELLRAPKSPAPGVSISNAKKPGLTGTLGFFAKSEGRLGFITCEHVACSNYHYVGSSDGPGVLIMPGSIDEEANGRSIAWLHDDDLPRLATGADADNGFDAVFCELQDQSFNAKAASVFNGKRLVGIAEPRELLDEGFSVFKLGRTTGLTAGRIIQSGVARAPVILQWRTNSRTAFFNNVIVVEGEGDGAFAKPGDSGAPVWNSQGHLVGIVFAVTEKGGANNRGLTYVSPAKAIIDGLKITAIY